MSPKLAQEKGTLLPTTASETKRRSRIVRKLHLVPLLLIGLALYKYGCFGYFEGGPADLSDDVKQELCPQPKPLSPAKNADLWEALGKKYETKEFEKTAIDLLSGAVQIPYVLVIQITSKLTMSLLSIEHRAMIRCNP